MELIGNLKKKVDKASSKEEKRELIEKAGMKPQCQKKAQSDF